MEELLAICDDITGLCHMALECAEGMVTSEAPEPIRVAVGRVMVMAGEAMGLIVRAEAAAKEILSDIADVLHEA